MIFKLIFSFISPRLMINKFILLKFLKIFLNVNYFLTNYFFLSEEQLVFSRSSLLQKPSSAKVFRPKNYYQESLLKYRALYQDGVGLLYWEPEEWEIKFSFFFSFTWLGKIFSWGFLQSIVLLQQRLVLDFHTKFSEWDKN